MWKEQRPHRCPVHGAGQPADDAVLNPLRTGLAGLPPLSMLPALEFFVLAQRRIVSGLTGLAGSIKA